MIDLHCHILDAIDDGARDADDSVGMARQAEEDGIEAVCATPHIRHDHDVRIEELAGRVHGLNVKLEQEMIAVKILQGGEVAETAVEGLSKEELGQVSLGGGDWILLEPAPGPLGETLLRRVGHLADRGHRTLIAHPERHLSADMFERMAALVAEGALIQATADYFLREQMAAGMLAMAERGLVHVLSSDAHSMRAGRPVRLSPALERLREVEWLAPHLEWIAETAPRAIVSGEPLELPFQPQP
ncbi:MAG TPA: CpsB/CapC family capsule biosynthesis tyrosine phosphatase [Solirubrobacterales bacterium]|jgi:protein-tyrosine phosphatase|nr:CpsB/CapC family capsule biosynthesis tyrosine phosphatase [Solirubrobacterales bacterium]